MRARLAVPVLSLCLLLSLSTAALAVGTLDQEQSQADPQGLPTEFCSAQTFTAGLTGKLDRVSLYLQTGDHEEDLLVQLRDTSSSGDPGSDVLAEQVLSRSAVGGNLGWVDIDFVTPADVVAGTKYTIVFVDAEPGSLGFAFEFGLAHTDPYDAGALYRAPSCSDPFALLDDGRIDLAFRTYVTTSVDMPPTDVDDDLMAAGDSGIPPIVYLLVVIAGFAAGTLLARHARGRV